VPRLTDILAQGQSPPAPMLLPASRIEKQKQTSSAAPIRETAYETGGVPLTYFD